MSKERAFFAHPNKTRALYAQNLQRKSGDGAKTSYRNAGTVTQEDVTRALRAAVTVGVEIARVEIDTRTGNIVIMTPRAFSTTVAAYDVWKAQSDAR